MFTEKDRLQLRLLQEEIEKLKKNAACYGSDFSNEGEYTLNANKLRDKLHEIDSRSSYYREDRETVHLTATEILKRFNELYSLLSVDRVQEPYGTLRKRS